MKKKTPIIIAVCAVVAIALIVAIVLIIRSKTGYRQVKVEEVTGDVTVVRDEDKMDAFEGMKLITDDEVRVKKKSTILLLVDDDKHITADPETKFKLEATGSKKDGKVEFEILEGGAMFTIDEKLPENSTFKVSTANATMSVRGTKFAVTYDPDKNLTTLEVFEGTVNVKYENDTDSENVEAGEGRVITEDATYVGDSLEEAFEAFNNLVGGIGAAIDGGFGVVAGEGYAPISGGPVAQYNNVISNMASFVALNGGGRLQAEYLGYDYMLFDYDHDGEKEVILYLRYYNDEDVYILDLCFLDYTDATGVYVNAITTGDVDDSCYYADLNGSLVRYSWSTSPYESYIYEVDTSKDGVLMYVLVDAFDEVIMDYDITGTPVPLYGYWEMIFDDSL